ncbi:MAG: Beta-ketoacyl-[acyl-carrier-protein] synthase [Cyanobacteria bacterium RYN_339]|nr:Beta-ketoacyl-[acyl-carrier-protein] synthase [Cyanobacteria bacterium RYN_339]
MTVPATPLVITGIGVASALGLGRTAHWDALVAGKSAITAWAQDPADPLPVHGGARLENFNVAPYLADRKMARLLSRASALGFAASHMALEDAHIDMSAIPGERRGLFCQTGMFQVESRDLAPIVEHCCEDGALSLARFGEKGMSVINPFLPIKTLPNMGLGALSIAFDMQGPNLVAGPFAAQGAMLLGLAASALVENEADVCLVAGGDAPFNMMTLSSLLAMDVLDTRELPHLGLFDPANAGLILGEGGVALVIEREADAIARGATIYARFAAWSMAGGDQVRHGAAASSAASEHVLADVGREADAVIVEGSGMPAVDRLEQALLAGHTYAGSKPQVGDWPGASTLLDVAHGALALHTGQWLGGAKSVLVHGLDLSGTASAVRLEAV